MFGQLIDKDELWVTGGDYADDAIPLLRKLSTKIQMYCAMDAYRRDTWNLELGSDEANTIMVNSSITSSLDSLRTIDTKSTSERPSKVPKYDYSTHNPQLAAPFDPNDEGYVHKCSRVGGTSGRLAPFEGGRCNPCHYITQSTKGKGLSLIHI